MAGEAAYHSLLDSMALRAYSRRKAPGLGSLGEPPMCSRPQWKGWTRRLSSVVQRRVLLRRVLRSYLIILVPSRFKFTVCLSEERRLASTLVRGTIVRINQLNGAG